MTVFTITVGAPGSGKTTWAEAQPTAPLLLERDKMRMALFGSRRKYWEHPDHVASSHIVGAALYAAMTTALVHKTHSHIIMSDTGVAWGQVRRFVENAWVRQVGIEVALFEVPWEIILERNDARQGTDQYVPEDALNRFLNAEPWWTERSEIRKVRRFDEFGKEKT